MTHQLIECQVQETHWDGVDAVRWWVLSLVGAELMLEVEVYVPKLVAAWVPSAQLGIRLHDAAEVRLCSTCAYVSSILGKLANAHAVEENLQNWDRISEVHKERIKFEFSAEEGPLGPRSDVCLGMVSHDAGLDRTLHSAEVSAEAVSGRSWERRQETLCG